MSLAEAFVRIPELNKKDGLSYAFTDEGIELPIVDVAHPAFALEPSEAELAAMMDGSIVYMKRLAGMPAILRKLLMSRMLRGSTLAALLSAARGGVVGGMATYMMKLGPENLGSWAVKADRGIASSLPCYSARLRLRDTATLLAQALLRCLDAIPGRKLRLVNIGGGPAMDSVNALMIARRASPGILEARELGILVLDRDAGGPAFGARALAAQMERGKPLAGLDIRMECRLYDWNEADRLDALLGGDEPDGEIAAFSSEGGLFEYGSDEVVSANLRVLAERAPHGAAFVGTMSRAEPPARAINEGSGAAVRFRSLDDLAELVSTSGWRLEKAVECPLSRSVLLTRS